MAISSLDTLDIAKRLKEAGFSEAQAEAVTTVFRDVRTTDLGPLATKADIERLQAATKTDIEAVRGDIRRLEAKSDSQIELLRRDLTIRLGSMIVVGVGLLLAAKFFG
jgi:hypothetical protein